MRFIIIFILLTSNILLYSQMVPIYGELGNRYEVEFTSYPKKIKEWSYGYVWVYDGPDFVQKIGYRRSRKGEGEPAIVCVIISYYFDDCEKRVKKSSISINYTTLENHVKELRVYKGKCNDTFRTNKYMSRKEKKADSH